MPFIIKRCKYCEKYGDITCTCNSGSPFCVHLCPCKAHPDSDEYTPPPTDPDARRTHITLVANILAQARQDIIALRLGVGPDANSLMKHFIRTCEKKLSDLEALRCDSCEQWVWEQDAELIEEVTGHPDSPDCRVDKVLVCNDCKLCPPDPEER